MLIVSLRENIAGVTCSRELERKNAKPAPAIHRAADIRSRLCLHRL